MRILLISFSEHYTYQETIYNLSAELDGKNGTEIWTMGTKELKYDVSLTEKNVLVDCPPRPGLTKSTFNFNLINAIQEKINAINPDVILFYSVHLWNILLSIKLKKKYRLVHVIHDVIPHKGDKQEKFVHIYNWLTARVADLIVLHNEQLVNTFSHKYKYPNHKVKFTDLWRKYEDYSPLKNTGKCLFFGRINYYKGINHLLEIVKNCPNIEFNIVGRVDKGLEETVSQFENFSNVHLNTNYVDGRQMRYYFENSDFVILPYESATQSGVIIDAYSFSRPVIAFDVGALNEQVKPGVSGFLVDAHNIEDFVKILKKCTDMKNETKDELAFNAWNYGYKKFSIQDGAGRLLKLLNDD